MDSVQILSGIKNCMKFLHQHLSDLEPASCNRGLAVSHASELLRKRSRQRLAGL